MGAPSPKSKAGKRNITLRVAPVGGGRKGGFLGFKTRGRKTKPDGAPAAKQQANEQRQAVQGRFGDIQMTKKLMRASTRCLDGVELKWNAVLKFAIARVENGGFAPKFVAQRIARSAGSSIETLKRWTRMALAGQSLKRKPGSGRKRSVTTKRMRQWFIAKHRMWKGHWNLRKMARAMKLESNGRGSFGTVRRLVRECHFKMTVPRLLPILTRSHMDKRVLFANFLSTKTSSPLFKKDVVVCMVDEKWFVRHRHGAMWMGPDEKRPAEFLQSKLHETKIMFLGALAVPRPEHGFDGGVGLWPIGSVVAATRSSSNRPAGARVFKSAEMDKDSTMRMMKENVVPSILEKCGKWVKDIVVIMDNAGGHGGGRGDMNNTTLAQLNSWGAEFVKTTTKFKQLHSIEFRAQSPHSPDMNVLDAGAWWSLQVAVDQLVDKEGESAAPIAVHDAVLEAWSTWVSSDKIQKLFDDILLNCEEVIKTSGGNLYLQPRHNT